MASNFPPAPPPMDRVRIAVYSDVSRLATVAIAGCSNSPIFQSRHPYYTSYPEDTYRSCAHIFAKLITDPQHIVLVVLDTYDEHEYNKTATYPTPHDHEPLNKLSPVGVLEVVEDQVIVGVAAWKLPPWSPRIGQFSSIPPPPNAPVIFDGGQGRDGNFDQCPPAWDFRSACESFKERFVPPPTRWKYNRSSKRLDSCHQIP